MKESDFIQQLTNRAHEQEVLMQKMVFPRVFSFTAVWLGEHPWRYLIPLAFLISLALHIGFGKTYDDLILRIFGGFGVLFHKS